MFCLSLISEAKMQQTAAQVLDKTWTSMDKKRDRSPLRKTVIQHGRKSPIL
jgi:hypothetical protein